MMRRLVPSRSHSGGLVATLLLLLCLTPSNRAVLAFDKTWFPYSSSCANGSGLWDDAPGAGSHNESAFFWVDTKSNADELCSYSSPVFDPFDSTSLKLSVRAAVNDGATLTVAVHGFAPEGSPTALSGCGDEPLASVVIHGNPTLASNQPFLKHRDSRNEFVTEWVDLPPGLRMSIDLVCVTLDDSPNAVASERASALIDYIKISQSLTPPPPICEGACLMYPDPTLVWQETFQRAK